MRFLAAVVFALLVPGFADSGQEPVCGTLRVINQQADLYSRWLREMRDHFRDSVMQVPLNEIEDHNIGAFSVLSVASEMLLGEIDVDGHPIFESYVGLGPAIDAALRLHQCAAR